MTEQIPGQMSIFDLDIWCGKTYPEPSLPTKVKTSGRSCRKPQRSQTKMPLYLDLRGGGGLLPVASWEKGGALLGVYMMRSFGECPREERESRLSQILEDTPHPKYCLSAKACSGILRRAEKRGKKLPNLLEKTLKRQSAFKNEPDVVGGVRESLSSMSEQEHCQHSTTNQYCLNDQGGQQIDVSENVSGTLRAEEHGHQPAVVYGISAYESNAMKSPNPESGIYEADTTRTLDNNGGNPACNQGGMIVLEGNGSRDSHRGDGYKESEISYSLNTVEHHAVCVGNGQMDNITMKSIANGLDCMHDQQAVMTYGLDRASFNQGQNALYDFSVEEEKAQTIVAKGPGGVLTKQ